MNGKLLTIVPGLLLLAACATEPTVRPPILNCQTRSPSACSGGNMVTLHKQAGVWDVDPECIKVAPGESFDINIPPDPVLGTTVVTVPEDAANGWLVAASGNAGNALKIHISVPSNTEKYMDYKYLVLSNGGVCLDPRVHVE